ncbi:MAG: creatininase family protein [Verrucomicrobiota bacterium]
MRLETLPWPEVADACEAAGGFLMLPIGATEQHGPHLPINCDTVIADSVCAYASRSTETPMLPALSVTVSSGHTAKWPGTFSLSHETFLHSVEEIAEWAATTGWEKLLLVNSHFGNDATLRVAVEKIRLTHLGKLQVGLRNTFQLTPAIWEYFVSDADDLHANKAETDLMLHLTPDLVRMDQVEDDPDRTDGTIFSYPVAQTSLNGVTGRPSLGSAERGKKLFEEMGEALSTIIRSAKNEVAPLDRTHWESLIE